MENNENYKEVLTKKGVKNTKHRNSILEILENTNKPLSADEIFLILRKTNSSISLSTVYRIMDKLIEKNIVVKTCLLNSSKAIYEINKKEHNHYIICIKCNKIVEIEDCPFEELEKKIKNRTGFEIKNHKFEIYGYCENCKRPE